MSINNESETSSPVKEQSNDTPNHILGFFANLTPVLMAADKEMIAYAVPDDGQWQKVPDLVSVLAGKFGWDKKTTYAHEPIVREFIRRHPKWCIGLGAKGGIIPRHLIETKEAEKQARLNAKKEIMSVINAKVIENDTSNVEEDNDE